MAVVGIVEGFEGPNVRGWASSSEATCRVSVADAAGNVIASGSATKRQYSGEPPPFRYRFEIPTGMSKASLVRVFADGHELAGSPLTLGQALFDGTIQIAHGKISGWVQERTVKARPKPVRLYDQYGRLLVTLMPRSERGDGLGPFAFECDVPASLYGWSEIGVYAQCENVVFAKTTCSLRVEGYLDTVGAGHIAGWAMVPGMPEKKLALQFSIDGQVVAAAICNMKRPDLLAKYPMAGDEVLQCGFDTSWDGELAPVAAHTLAIQIADSGIEVFNGPHGVSNVPWAVQTLRKAAGLFGAHGDLSGLERSFVRRNLATMIAGCRSPGARLVFRAGGVASRRPRLSIIIPVYRDVETTRECIESVLTHRRKATDTVIVINDKSPEPAMEAMLESEFGREPNFWILSNPVNKGFVGAVNRGLGMARLGDVLLLNSDTEVFAGGIDELVRCADQSKSIGTVTPLSNNATIFTYPHPTLPTAVLADTPWSEIAARALSRSRHLIDVPTGHGFCLYIKREALDQAGFLDEVFGRGYGEENDLCQRIADLGYRNVATPTVFVRHRESISFGEEKDKLRARNLDILRDRYPEYQAFINNWLREDPLRKARWAIDRERLREARAEGRRFVVSVENDLTGGTVQAMQDIERHVGYGERTVVRCRAEGDLVMLFAENLGLISAYGPDDMDELFVTLGCLQPQLFAVHQLLGYGEDFVRRLTAASAETATVFFAHDFYTLCPRTTMIDAIDRFCGGPTERCEACITTSGPHERSVMHGTPTQHRRILSAFLLGCANVIAPSRDAASRLNAAFPGLNAEAIPHPEVRPVPRLCRKRRDPSKVVVLGAIGPHKGSAALLELARTAQLDAPAFRFHVVGYTDLDDKLKLLDNVVLHGKYKQKELAAILGDINAATAIFLHRWPETYSYTFSEIVRHGIIPIVPNLGGPAERARDLGFGVTFSPQATPSELIDAIRGAQGGDPNSALRHLNRTARSSIVDLTKVLHRQDVEIQAGVTQPA